MKKILFSFSLILLFSSSVFAEWKYIGEHSDEKISFYIDTDNIKQIDNDIFSYTMLEDYGIELVIGTGVLSSINDEQIDCKNKKFRKRHSIFFTENMGAGEQFYVMDLEGFKSRGFHIWYQIDKDGKDTWQNGTEVDSELPLIIHNLICTS
tara:strand:- start:128 stop:580 length:453 start_codon:yes stop_codon:yes gene_type:complete